MVVIEASSRRLEEHLETIQGNILHGYRSARALYLFYAVPNATAGRSFLGSLAPQVETALPVPQPTGTEARVVVNVALTCAGLRKLGVDDTIVDQLPAAFRRPIAERAALLLDDQGKSDPKHWDPGLGDGRAHILVTLNQVVDPDHEYPTDVDAVEAMETQRLTFEEHRQSMADFAASFGLVEVHAQLAELLHNRREHFGWADGLGQPAIEGALADNTSAFGGSPRIKDGSADGWRPIKAGEFLHGYADEDGLATEGPAAQLLQDGTFMVYRKLFQDIVAFREQLQADANAYRAHLGLDLSDRDAYELMAAKVVGRWRDGKAISLFPERPPMYLGDTAEPSPSNDFRYYSADQSGATCPLGAHIRRTNPRDALGWEGGGEMSERHRIIRRGMPYGPFREWDPENPANTTPDGVDRGLIFICFNADIERQFEVIQRQWCNDGNLFALDNEKDYLLGDHLAEQPGPDGRARARHLTIQQAPKSPPHLIAMTPPAVWTKGCEYLLVPGMEALLAISTGAFGPPVDPPEESARVARVVALAQADVARQYPQGTKPVGRDQHPRAHGLVRARFTISDDVPEGLQVGVFAQPGRTYDAWVRFSSRAGGPKATDEKRDAHGMAIKVLGVEGRKVLAAEADATTQDFVLANSPAFFCRDAEAYVELATKSGNGKLLSFFIGFNPFRWRLRALRNLIRAVTRRVTSPLEIRYWSQTPSNLGGYAVKYSAAPVQVGGFTLARMSGPEQIGDTMAAQLAGSDATFDFMIQLQGDTIAMPIEDPTVRWDEDASPFQTVATLHIPKQDFRSARRQHLAEHLSFTPWHSLPEHAPLGSINRVRRAVYDAISAERHARNGEPRYEPKELEDC